MKRSTSLLASLAFAAPVFLGAGAAAAQDGRYYPDARDGRYDAPDRGAYGDHGWRDDDRFDPRADGRFDARQDGRFDPRADARFAPDDRFASRFAARPTPVRRIAQVQSLLTSRRGRLSGVVLSDGTTVLLRSADRMLARRLRPGQLVRIRGMTMAGNESMIRNATISLLRAGGMQPGYGAPVPPPYAAPAPMPAPAPPQALPQAFSALGSVRRIIASANGQLQTIVLDNGSTVSIPASLARSLVQHGLRVGDRIAVAGHRASDQPGAALIADAVRLADGSAFGSLPTSLPGFTW